ncbi:amino acid ABC transporter permease [Trichormus azollae]|jgi:general L-amino acid transport system permease protein|uniref:Polar amino acid ABC transporter, inner membrane subunit n=1 Tax=Nostoc azollae (strain 0708) TaxID=551115 RepID=D7DYU4_NOSA0|nr:amino acid ABC transporter permease [Trichormus azollae]ADI64423.1 polar amino acid ABC transporter, inner membrane subunit ['Nostoc azollae' 0708]
MNKVTWLRKNLFSTWYNTLLTIICLYFLFWIVKGCLLWAFDQAQWQVIPVNLHLFLVGRFLQSLYWRIWIVLGIITILTLITLSLFTKKSNIIKRRFSQSITPWIAPTWLLSFPINIWLIGGGFGLQSVSTNLWNGLLLTLLMAIVSIVLSFPIGVILALGRTSNLFLTRWFSILYIEIVRGLPIIGILFIAQVMLPLFLPTELRLDRLIRGIAGLVLFSAAYMAENVRGGLQSIPRGQTEASKALGFNTPLVVILIILPQALRAVIPAIVGQFISLFKDTSLLSLVGLVELTGIARSILAQPQFLGRYAEVYIFIGLIYCLFCYSMSLASRKLEKQLGN